MEKGSNKSTKSTKSNKSETSKLKCVTCEQYSKDGQKCKLGKNCKTEFSNCDDYLINSKLINF